MRVTAGTQSDWLYKGGQSTCQGSFMFAARGHARERTRPFTVVKRAYDYWFFVAYTQHRHQIVRFVATTK